jgi:hypothetical protein
MTVLDLSGKYIKLNGTKVGRILGWKKGRGNKIIFLVYLYKRTKPKVLEVVAATPFWEVAGK